MMVVPTMMMMVVVMMAVVAVAAGGGDLREVDGRKLVRRVHGTLHALSAAASGPARTRRRLA